MVKICAPTCVVGVSSFCFGGGFMNRGRKAPNLNTREPCKPCLFPADLDCTIVDNVHFQMNKRGNTPPPPSSKPGGKGKGAAGRGVGKSKTMR